MKKTFLALAVLLVSFNSLAAYKVNCVGKDSFVKADIKVIGEPETNGTWNYVMVDATVHFNVKKVERKISQKLNMVLTDSGWSLIVFKIHDKSSDTVSIESVNGILDIKVVASVKDGIVQTHLTCDEY